MDDALRIVDEAFNLMQSNEYEVASLQVMQLVAASTYSAYDGEFVVLAKDLSLQLVTVDSRILEQFLNVAISLDEYVS